MFLILNVSYIKCFLYYMVNKDSYDKIIAQSYTTEFAYLKSFVFKLQVYESFVEKILVTCESVNIHINIHTKVNEIENL